MNFHWFAHIIVHRPLVILISVALISATCLIIPFTLKSKPFRDFADPKMGFSTRGTTISDRLIAWRNLEESTRPSGQFAVNPKDILIQQQQQQQRNQTAVSKQKSKKNNGKNKKNKKLQKNDFSNVFITESSNRSDNSYENWIALKNMLHPKNAKKINTKRIEVDGFFCGYPDERYAHIVLESENNIDMFTLNSLQALCRLEHEFIEAHSYKSLCISNVGMRKKCCKPWSLANYIAILHNRTNCLGITEEDVWATKELLVNCSQYFHNLQLSSDCAFKGYCDAPTECIKHDAVFNILNFLTSTNFLPPNNTINHTVLHETMIFLPLATSTVILPYYHEIEKLHLKYDGISVVAMEFGLKDALFDECLLRDSWLMMMGALFVLVCIWLYTESLFLTIMTIIAIICSLGISYFIYMLVFELDFFPFMNLLAIIVAIGIGSDDAFIFCKIWNTVKEENNGATMVKIMSDSMYHAFLSMFVTSLTTSVAFLASYASSVTAICCFSIFSGTAVITNFLLMVTWFPACIVVWERSCCSNVDIIRSCLMACLQRWCCSRLIRPTWNLSATSWPRYSCLSKIWEAKERFLLDTVINMRYLWFTLFSIVALVSAIIVIYYPKLQLPNTAEFQLFDSSHPFEKYDFRYKNHFWFKREERMTQEYGANFKLPLRFVWGVLPEDNGDHLNPESYGTLSLDPEFDMAEPVAQKWLFEFCKHLRNQSFYQATFGPLLPNCFIDTFVKSMQRPCYDEFSSRNHSPCCESSKFPYSKPVFTECIIEEMSDIYQTPSQYLIPGIAGPKFSKDQSPTIKAVIVEYDSNYSYSMSYDYMHEFYTLVEKWMLNELKTAPKSMQNGWFISELEFYDLQSELSKGTSQSITVSMGLALIVLLLSTLNLLTSLYAILTITCSIFVTVAILVLLGWKLNILESIAVSTAIGLTVDFSLHYTVNYRLCPIALSNDRIEATKYAVSNMAGPALMAALTTGAAGAFMTPSLILPYIQIGVFLLTVMSVSWLYATFHLGSILAIFGPQNQFGQFHYSLLFHCFEFLNKSKTSSSSSNERNRPVTSVSLSLDTHELDSLTSTSLKNHSFNSSSNMRAKLPRPLNRSLSRGTHDNDDDDDDDDDDHHDKCRDNRSVIGCGGGAAGGSRGVDVSTSCQMGVLCSTTDSRQGSCSSSSHLNNAMKNSNRYVFTDQSPSATSAITIIMADDN